MSDKREQILLRLKAILETIPTIVTVVRNRGLMDNDSRPAAYLLDGDESFRLTGDRKGRVTMSQELITMRPQIFVIGKSLKPQNEGVGAALNGYRIGIIRAIAQDAALLALVGSNGDIAYNGCETDLKNGSLLDGQLRLDFAITYVLDPYDQPPPYE